jgi:hypothetical protein
MTETIEQAAEIRFGTDMDSIRGSNVYDLNADLKRGFIEGANWVADKMYSEEDMIAFMQFIVSQESLGNTSSVSITTAKYYLEQFKNK